MKFLIKVIISWFKRNETPVVIYGADGVPITSYNTKAKECWFPKNLGEASSIGNGWYCYPLNANGEYCGCICWEWWENANDDFEQPDVYDILNICRLLEIGCGEDENS